MHCASINIKFQVCEKELSFDGPKVIRSPLTAQDKNNVIIIYKKMNITRE